MGSNPVEALSTENRVEGGRLCHVRNECVDLNAFHGPGKLEDRMKEGHDAIHAWRAANNRAFAGTSWEIYGDWSDDPANSKPRSYIC